MRTVVIAALSLLALAIPFASRARAADNKNLDEGRPVRIEDAFPIETGGWEALAGGGFALERQGPTRGFFPVGINYGAFPHTQFSLGSTVLSPAETGGRPKSGDLEAAVRYNFYQEGLFIPALAFKFGVTMPTGVGSHGVDVELKGMATRKTGQAYLHLNAAYDVFDDTDRDERGGRYRLAFGPSYTLPHHAQTTLVGDVFVRQPVAIGTPTVVGLEVGVRRQLIPNLVVDAGIGIEFAGPRDRAPFLLTIGISYDF